MDVSTREVLLRYQRQHLASQFVSCMNDAFGEPSWWYASMPCMVAGEPARNIHGYQVTIGTRSKSRLLHDTEVGFSVQKHDTLDQFAVAIYDVVGGKVKCVQMSLFERAENGMYCCMGCRINEFPDGWRTAEADDALATLKKLMRHLRNPASPSVVFDKCAKDANVRVPVHT